MTKKKVLYNLSRASYQKNWGSQYQQPTSGEKFLAFLARFLPKIGPLKALQLRTPTPETERMFEASFNATLDRYRHLLSQVGTGPLDLPNDNFDTGETTGAGKYRLNDGTHARWLHALAKQNFISASPDVRAELEEFFGHPDAPYATKQKPKDWAKVQAELEQLKKAAPPEVTGEADGLPLRSPQISECRELTANTFLRKEGCCRFSRTVRPTLPVRSVAPITATESGRNNASSPVLISRLATLTVSSRCSS